MPRDGCFVGLCQALKCCVRRQRPKDENIAVVDGTCAFSTLQPYLIEHGQSSMAWSSLQDGVRHFLIPGVGFLSYTFTEPAFLGLYAWSRVLVLSDPVAAPSSWPLVLRAFVKKYKRATFLHISHEFGQVVSRELGYDVNSMGGETQLDVSAYNFKGANGRAVRLDASRAQRAGVVVEEVTRVSDHVALPADVADQLRDVSAEWEVDKGTARPWFLLRPPMYEDEPPSTRMFVAWAYVPPSSDVPVKAICSKKSDPIMPASEDLMRKPDSQVCLLRSSPTSSIKLCPIKPLLAFTAADSGPESYNGRSPSCSSTGLGRGGCGYGSEGSSGSDEAGCYERRVVGFCVLDPMWRDGSIIGYIRNVTRTSAAAHKATVSLMTKVVLDTLRGEQEAAAAARRLADQPPPPTRPETPDQSTAQAAATTKSARKQRARQARAAAAAAERATVAGTRPNPADPAAAGTALTGGAAAGPVLTSRAGSQTQASGAAAAVAGAGQHAASSPAVGSTLTGAGLVLSLGMSPSYCMVEDRKAFHHNPWVRWMYDWLWRYGGAFYPFHGIASSKARYGGGGATLEATGQYADPATRWLPCWQATGAGMRGLGEQVQIGVTTGLIHSRVVHNIVRVLQHAFAQRGHKGQAAANNS